MMRRMAKVCVGRRAISLYLLVSIALVTWLTVARYGTQPAHQATSPRSAGAPREPREDSVHVGLGLKQQSDLYLHSRPTDGSAESEDRTRLAASTADSPRESPSQAKDVPRSRSIQTAITSAQNFRNRSPVTRKNLQAGRTPASMKTAAPKLRAQVAERKDHRAMTRIGQPRNATVALVTAGHLPSAVTLARLPATAVRAKGAATARAVASAGRQRGVTFFPRATKAAAGSPPANGSVRHRATAGGAAKRTATSKQATGVSQATARLTGGLTSNKAADAGQASWRTAQTKASNASITLAEAFRPLLSADKKASLLRCLRLLANGFAKTNVTYFLYAGSLLGARRHRGIIPWDDDVDILANLSQAKEIETALTKAPGCTPIKAKPWLYKLYPNDADPIPRRAWKWPFIDVFLYNETATHLVDITPMADGVYTFAKEDVFPLAYRPFEGILLPVPGNSERVLSLDFHPELCKTGYYSHRYEADIPDEEVYSVPCQKLYGIHPFVFRGRVGNLTKEVIKIGSKVIQEYIFE